MKIKKNNIWKLALVACLIVLSIAGSSLAYFTDIDHKTNVFTAGNVDITLTQNETTTRLYPGQSYTQTATIANVGTEDAFVGAIITIPVPNDADPAVLTDEAVVGILNIPDGLKTAWVKDNTGYTVYVLADTALAKPTDGVTATVDVLTGIVIPTAWGNNEMALFNNVSIKVTAYAVQTVGFNNDAEAALKAAFEAAWPSSLTFASAQP